MLIDTRQTLHNQPCADLCRACENCCWYILRPLCPEWADPPDCKTQLPQDCVLIYHQLNSETEGGCADCCDDLETDEGKAECRCGAWYSTGPIFEPEYRCTSGSTYIDEQGNEVSFPCCNKGCNGKQCVPIATTGRDLIDVPECRSDNPSQPPPCRAIRPIYTWRGKCWTLVRAGLGDDSIGSCPDDSFVGDIRQFCRDGDSWPGLPDPYDIPCERRDCGEGNASCPVCCDSCDVEIIDYCEWDGQLLTIDYYCGGFGGPFCNNDPIRATCGDCLDGCGDDPGPQTCHGNCAENCPSGQRCCPPPPGDDRCFCKDENIECDQTGDCDLAGPCCPFGNQSHSLSVSINIKSAFELGPTESSCTGTLEDGFAEAFGGQSLRVPLDPSALDGLTIDCGNSTQGNALICSKQDMCGSTPEFPTVTPASGPPTECVDNCGIIDQLCCPTTFPAFITDYIECGFGNIPHSNYDCLKGYTAFGQRHLGLQMVLSFSVECTQGSGNKFDVGEKGLLQCPRIKLGHWCTSDDSLRFNCSQPSCCHGGIPNGWGLSYSIGSTGSIGIPGTFVGYVETSGATLPNCTGVVRMQVTFNPDNTDLYLPISFGSACSGLKHPCQGTGSVYQWFDWDAAIANIEGIDGDRILAGRIRENCGIKPPRQFHPEESGLVSEIMALYEATGRTEFAALELPTAIDILQLSFANRSACGTSTPIESQRSYRTEGFAGCDLGTATHACNRCNNSVVDLNKQGWNLGTIRAYGRMTYS